MDSSSWIHGNGGGFMCGYAAREQEKEQQLHELLVSSEIQQHLDQISMELNMDNGEAAGAYSQQCSSVVDDMELLTNSYHASGGCSFPSSSSTLSSSCSPEISSIAPRIAVQFPEVSSFMAPGGVVLLPYDDTAAAMTPGEMAWTSAFRRYERHLSPQRRLTKPACGQRMFKTAMSVLAKMHTSMSYSHQQQQQRASAAEPSENQLQHLISERKRREKLNDSFCALKTVLPLVSKPKKKLGQASVLIIAREYVNSLKSKIHELEEKNQSLEAQLALCATREDCPSEKVEIQIIRAATAKGYQTGDVCKVKIETAAHGNTTDVVFRILQGLKDQMGEDVSLVSMSASEDGYGPRRASLTLHLKLVSGAKWEYGAVRDAVTKAMHDENDAGPSQRC